MPFCHGEDARRYVEAGYWSVDETLLLSWRGTRIRGRGIWPWSMTWGTGSATGSCTGGPSRLAAAIAGLGIGPGDVVGLQFPESGRGVGSRAGY